MSDMESSGDARHLMHAGTLSNAGPPTRYPSTMTSVGIRLNGTIFGRLGVSLAFVARVTRRLVVLRQDQEAPRRLLQHPAHVFRFLSNM